MTAPPVIAIVDDDAAVLEALGNLFRSFDMAVELYASGDAFFRADAIDRIACLVTDIQMPAMDGFALCEALRARGSSIPVIMMTALPEMAHRQRAAAIGAACLLDKPFIDDDIIGCVREVLA